MEPITHKCDSDHPEWNESYYLAFFNKEQNIGGVSRIGFKPNKKEGMTFFFLFLPDGIAAIYHKEELIENYLKFPPVGDMAHYCEPDGKWEYKFQGKMVFFKNPEELPKIQEKSKFALLLMLIRKQIRKKQVKMKLTFKAISDVYEYSEFMTPESLELGKKAGDKHWEQIAIISGEIQIGNGKTYNISNTIGQRDHTFGIRDWTGVGDWLYYVIWFNENLAINPAAIIADDGRLSTGGFLFKDGKNIPLKTIRVLDQQFRKDGILPISSKLEIVDFNENKHILKAQVGPIIPVPFEDNEGNKSILVQSFGTFELDDITGGYGTFETLRRVN
ncbi:MAG: hypothetical protein EU535_02765 [Promethearchaeota archaeon]|nr:MAG: hypothetical protein EU535_02765 [Candidatus Lokiarchaeota archaeon]